MLLVISVMIVTNKTFSPQYMIWLGGPHAAGFALLGRRSLNTEGYSAERAAAWVISLFILTCTVLTGIVFLDRLRSPSSRLWAGRLVLAAGHRSWWTRNVLITALLGYVVGCRLRRAPPNREVGTCRTSASRSWRCSPGRSAGC